MTMIKKLTGLVLAYLILASALQCAVAQKEKEGP